MIQFQFIPWIYPVFTKGRLRTERLGLIPFLYKQYKHNDNLFVLNNCMIKEVEMLKRRGW